MNRQDILRIKIELGFALGNKKDDYWSVLKDFLSGKINRAEFEFIIGQYLSKSHVHLHNQLIKAIFYNSQSIVPPPQYYESKTRTKLSARDIKLKKRILKVLTSEEIERLKNSANANAISKSSQLGARGISYPLLADERGELPDLKTMKNIIQEIVKSQGLNSLNDDSCVYVVQCALSTFLKNIISKASLISGETHVLTLKDIKFSLQVDRNLVIPKISTYSLIN